MPDGYSGSNRQQGDESIGGTFDISRRRREDQGNASTGPVLQPTRVSNWEKKLDIGTVVSDPGLDSAEAANSCVITMVISDELLVK